MERCAVVVKRDEREMYDVKDVMRICRCGATLAREHMRKLPHCIVGKTRMLVPREVLEDWMDEQTGRKLPAPMIAFPGGKQ